MTYTHAERVRMLYKTIIKLHRGLPAELRLLGTNYTRDEFKRHKTCNVKEAEIFMTEWTNYAISLTEQLGLKGLTVGTNKLGFPLGQRDIEHLRNDQIYQLYELMKEATNAQENAQMRDS